MQNVNLFVQYENLKVLQEKYQSLNYSRTKDCLDNLLDISKLLYPFEFLFVPNQPYGSLHLLLSTTFFKSGIRLDYFIEDIFRGIENLKLDEEFFEKFSKFYDHRIRRAIARNKYTPIHILENFLEDNEYDVVFYANETLKLIIKSNSNDG